MRNLHALASFVIPQTALSWQRFKANTTNEAGQTIPTYHEAETITGSLQPIDAADAEVLGLAMRGENVTLYTSAKISMAGAGKQPDIITHNGKDYEPVAISDWQAHSGWQRVTMVKK